MSVNTCPALTVPKLDTQVRGLLVAAIGEFQNLPRTHKVPITTQVRLKQPPGLGCLEG